MKGWLQKNKHIFVSSYMILYLAWFFWLEQRKNLVMTPIHIWLDDFIPFNEWFIIPYLLWFVYIIGTVFYFFLTSREDYYKSCAFLFIGMTICLIIYTIWPSCQNLRPQVFLRDNILTQLVRLIYSIDTATNVCPSIHVYNSVGIHIAIMESKQLGGNKWIRRGSFLLMVSICLSTVFLKQHSAFDGICALALSLVMYMLVYRVNYSSFIQKLKEKERYAIKNEIQE